MLDGVSNENWTSRFSWSKWLRLIRKLQASTILKIKRIAANKDTTILEYEDGYTSLEQFVQKNGEASRSLLKIVLRDILQALTILDRNNLVHGSITIYSIFINETQDQAKLGHLQNIRPNGISSRLNTHLIMEPPERLLGNEQLYPTTDIWQLGLTILFALRLIKPLSAEIIPDTYHILKWLFSILGIPNWNSWPEGAVLLSRQGLLFSNIDRLNILTNIPDPFRHLIRKMMSMNRKHRPTADQCLEHKFLTESTPRLIKQKQENSKRLVKSEQLRASKLSTSLKEVIQPDIVHKEIKTPKASSHFFVKQSGESFFLIKNEDFGMKLPRIRQSSHFYNDDDHQIGGQNICSIEQPRCEIDALNYDEQKKQNSSQIPQNDHLFQTDQAPINILHQNVPYQKFSTVLYSKNHEFARQIDRPLRNDRQYNNSALTQGEEMMLKLYQQPSEERNMQNLSRTDKQKGILSFTDFSTQKDVQNNLIKITENDVGMKSTINKNEISQQNHDFRPSQQMNIQHQVTGVHSLIESRELDRKKPGQPPPLNRSEFLNQQASPNIRDQSKITTKSRDDLFDPVGA